MVDIRTYALSVEPHEAEGYIATFPSLPGCRTWGASYEKAVRSAEEALVGYLDALQINGESLPEERLQKGVSLSVTVRTRIIA